MLVARAPAKVNLSLHVVGRRADGWHRLESLVAFAGVGDRVTLQPGRDLSLVVRGPTAGAAGATGDNLVLKAAQALAARRPGLVAGRFVLIKRLPVAAGLGGGSSDAAAALRLLAQQNGLAIDHPDVLAAAQATGADVPVCLAARARIMRGTGDDLGPPIALPTLAAVLVNPGVAVPTVAVFRALGLAPGADVSAAPHPDEAALPTAKARLVVALAGLRNDLEPPALALAPAISAAKSALEATQGVQLVRMSGSGATVFGLYPSCRAALAAARQINAAVPDWWTRSTVLRACAIVT